MYYQKNSIDEFNSSFDLQSYVLDNYPDAEHTGNYIKICCPFHHETTPSCIVYEKNYYCFGAGCNASGSSLDFLSKTTDSNIEDILSGDIRATYSGQSIRRSKRVAKTNYPKNYLVKKYNENLLNNSDKIEYLNRRHIDLHSIKKSNLGYSRSLPFFKNYIAPRYCIPVYDINNNLISARYRIDPKFEKRYSHEPKYLGHPSAPTMLYNAQILPSCSDVVIVGSELDALFLYYRYGIAAVAPPGEGNFNKDWASYFIGKKVLIWLDYDYAGILASIKTYKSLKHYADASIYEWGNEFSIKDDVCDFVTKYGILGVLNAFESYNIRPFIQQNQATR